MARRDYLLPIALNRKRFRMVVIDDHYEQRHKKSINDELIMELLKSISGGDFPVQLARPDGHQIIVVDPLWFNERSYRVILTDHPKGNYVGVINAFRRKL